MFLILNCYIIDITEVSIVINSRSINSNIFKGCKETFFDQILIKKSGNITVGGSGLQLRGLAYVFNDPFPTKADIQLIQLDKPKSFPKTQKLTPTFHIAKIVFIPLLYFLLLTLGHKKYSLKDKYLFLKSRNHANKH